MINLSMGNYFAKVPLELFIEEQARHKLVVGQLWEEIQILRGTKLEQDRQFAKPEHRPG